MDIYEELVRIRRQGGKAALATIVTTSGSIPSHAAAKMLVREDGTLVGTIGGGCVEAQVITGARKVMDLEKPEMFEFSLTQDPSMDSGLVCGGTLSVFVEPIVADPVLYVFGAGHVGLYTCRVARLAGFQVVIIDDRASFANPDRFPEASAVLADDWDKSMASLDPGDRSYIMIATRGHREDLRVLRWALTTRARYVGMIGSRRKVLTLAKTLQKEGVSQASLAALHAPIGLDIGATTPEEIAVAVVAELIAVRRQAALTPLRFPRMIPETPAAAGHALQP
jgi:xanthine dehydrogenase accessory factor